MRLITYTYLILLSQISYGQLKVSEVSNANDLMNILLGDNEDLIISNVTISGGKNSFGIFEHKLQFYDFFNQGIIMSNGIARNAIGPNDNTKESSRLNYNCDSDINRIAEYKGCYDTVLFEFDLISKTDEIQFRYFFGSEEYPEYVLKNVNDVFIFLVTNLSTNESENIAVLNGDKTIPITIDHINHKINSDYYIENINWDKSNLEKYRNNIKKLELPFTFQYDGFTKVLKAKAKVIPNAKYHFKLGISDVGDQLYDSAIFLESNSLKSTGKKSNLNGILTNIVREKSIDFKIRFAVSSSKIKGNNSFILMDEIIQQLKKDSLLNIKIVGHTDNTGSEEFNNELSVKRAESVKQYLISQNIEESRIKIQGMGSKQPKSNLISENRRVEIIFKKN